MKRFFSILVFLFSLLPYVAGAGSSIDLPAAYLGEFQWDRGGNVHQVFFVWNSQVQKTSNILVLEGIGVYGTTDKVSVNIKAELNLGSKTIEIWESVSENNDNFVTDGSHKGTFTADMKIIDTTWLQSGSKGRLRLVRKDSFRK